VDASVAIKWYLSEPESESAERLLDPEHDLIAPDLLFADFSDVPATLAALTAPR